MKHIIIGTAGHVDHGKTALVKALTGQDTDRLKEEKERGISIDLGFAHLPLTQELNAAIVDVPGHERFLKNMLAGIGGIDLALLVVAADEGIMPQTREHLDMLQLYGVKRGIVVITKVDKVDEEWLLLIEAEIEALVQGTFLAGAPLYRADSISGKGISDLRAGLIRLAELTSPRDSEAPARLWVDRVFSAKGHGLVITGGVLSGCITAGETLCLEPGGALVKVRGIESHGHKAERAAAGQRAAINLTGIDLEQVHRGMLLTSPERGLVSTVWDVYANWREEVKSGVRIRLHLGTGEWIGRLRRPSKAPPGVVRLSLESPLPGGAGEKGIIRLYSPQTLLGGIRLIAPADRKRRLESAAKLADAFEAGRTIDFLSELLVSAAGPLSLGEIKRAAGYLPGRQCEAAIAALTERGEALRQGDSYLAALTARRMLAKLQELLRQTHAASPDLSGMAREAARQKIGLDERWFDALVTSWTSQKQLAASGAILALPSHAARHGAWLSDVGGKVAAALGESGLCNIDVAMLGKMLGMNSVSAKPVYENLLRSGELVKLGDVVVYSKTLHSMIRIVQDHLRSNGTATAAQLKELMQTSRKLAIPILEYCDLQKFTIRAGDVRRVGTRTPPK